MGAPAPKPCRRPAAPARESRILIGYNISQGIGFCKGFFVNFCLFYESSKMLARFSSRFVRSVQPQTDGGKIRAPLRRLDEISLRLSGSPPQEPDVRKRAEPNHKKQGARKKTRPRAAGRSGTRGRGAGKRGAREKTQRARARRTGAERKTAARGNGTRGRKTTRPRAKGRCGTRNHGAGEQCARKKTRPRAAGRSGTRGRGAGKRGAREKTQRARARRTGAEREAAARGNGTRGRKTARPRAKDRCGTQDRSAGAELTRCGRGQAQGQWSRRTATKPSRTPITVKMAGFRLWAKACDCGSTSLKVT